MKIKARSFTAVLLSAVIVLMSAFPAFADEAVVPGDVDSDGVTTSTDALMILRSSVGLTELTPEQTNVADVTNDGDITSADALEALRMSMYVDGKFVPPEDPEAIKAKLAASAAVDAIQKGEVQGLINYTSEAMPLHQGLDFSMALMEALIKAFAPDTSEEEIAQSIVPRSEYDKYMVEMYTESNEAELSYLLMGFPITILDKYGKGGSKIEFTDATAFSYDKKAIAEEAAKYANDLPKYGVSEPQPGVTLKVDGSEGKLINFKGTEFRLYEMDPSRNEGTVNIEQGELPDLDFGKAFELKVKIDGKETDKKVRVVFCDGQYRVMVPDLMEII